MSDVIHVIPDELASEFQVAVDLNGGCTSDTWHDYCGMFERVARHVNTDAITGYHGTRGFLFLGPVFGDLLTRTINYCYDQAVRLSVRRSD